MQNPGRKIVHNAVHDAFFNTLTMGPAFPCVPARNNPWRICCYCYSFVSLSV